MKQIISVALIVISCSGIGAQRASPRALGWDLSYSSVLDANGVRHDEWIRRWFGSNYQSAAGKWIRRWNRGPIKSSVLLEFPAPHAGERITMWLVCTNNRAFYYERAEGNPLYPDGKPAREAKEPLDLKACEKFFDTVSAWQQLDPVKPEDTPRGGIPGYDGVLSVYSSGKSRQILLTIEDFAKCDTKDCRTWKTGRLAEALPIIPRFGRKPAKPRADRRN